MVDAVFAATRAELGRVGYTALRVEDVASISGVNKTTVYRRWPTKAELVGEAIEAGADHPPVPDTGDLRADLVRMLDDDVEYFLTPERVGLLRIFYTEIMNPEVASIGREVREANRRPRIARLQKAIEAGELPPEVRIEIILDVLIGTVYGKVARLREPVDHDYLVSLVGLVLDGAKAAGGTSRGGP